MGYDPHEYCKTLNTEYAILKLPNGEIIEGFITKFEGYSNGIIEVTINEVIYTTHFSNVILYQKNNGGSKMLFKILVIRPKDHVFVTIFRDEIDNTYRFINLTKGHICTCKFNSPEEAIADLDKHVEEGKVLKYKIFGSIEDIHRYEK